MARFSLSYVYHSGHAKEEDIDLYDEARTRFYKLKEERGIRYIYLINHETSKTLMEWYWFKIAEPIECADPINDVIVLGDE